MRWQTVGKEWVYNEALGNMRDGQKKKNCGNAGKSVKEEACGVGSEGAHDKKDCGNPQSFQT